MKPLIKPSYDETIALTLAVCRVLETIEKLFADHGEDEAAAKVTAMLLQLHEPFVEAFHPDPEILGPPKLPDARPAIAAAVLNFDALLTLLPEWAERAAKILSSRWPDHLMGRVATNLFLGPPQMPEIALASGRPEDGGLAQRILDFIERYRNPNSLSDETHERTQGTIGEKAIREELSHRWGRLNSLVRMPGTME